MFGRLVSKHFALSFSTVKEGICLALLLSTKRDISFSINKSNISIGYIIYKVALMDSLPIMGRS